MKEMWEKRTSLKKKWEQIGNIRESNDDDNFSKKFSFNFKYNFSFPIQL